MKYCLLKYRPGLYYVYKVYTYYISVFEINQSTDTIPLLVSASECKYIPDGKLTKSLYG